MIESIERWPSHDCHARASGPLTLPAGRNTTSDLITFANSTPYTSYKIDFPTNAGSGTATQFSEFDLQDTVPEPGGLVLLGAGALAALRRRRTRG